MRIHSNIITSKDLYSAVNIAHKEGTIPGGIVVDHATTHGSRKRTRGIEFRFGALPGTEGRKRSRNSGRYGADQDYLLAASYDDHGHIFEVLFRIDPDAIIGYYDGVEDFHAKTKYAFDKRPDVS